MAEAKSRGENRRVIPDRDGYRSMVGREICGNAGVDRPEGGGEEGDSNDI